MGSRISQLPLVGTTSDNDTMVVVQSGITSQVGVGDFIDLVETAYESMFTDLSWIRDFIYPVGSFYTQYPDADSNSEATEFPESMSPATLFGGTWAEQWANESIYFRTRGTLSDTDRVNGKQEDQMQGHYHNIQQATSGTPPPYSQVMTTGITGLSTQALTVRGAVTDGVNGTPRVGTETRTVNRRIKVWKRTA